MAALYALFNCLHTYTPTIVGLLFLKKSALDSQSEEHGTEEKLDNKEHRNFSMQKLFNNLGKRA
ncbi:27146_t:CDS:2 [Dentiscutata erythropus]|uniref:27146_t:CDS:1 n=1 Tax=Dentiscutata erythropus TaxID=1348616 RepID=A0A9N9DJL0_9GLOM|nr:27146_t:CDS:2 [Dentiscutata erythropus]